MSTFAIAGLQLVLEHGDNRDRIEHEVAATMARFPWVQMILLGELAAFGPGLSHAEPLPGPTERRFQALARKHAIWLLPGSIYEQHDGRIYNTASAIDPEGNVVARYRKIYPFLPYETGVASGNDIVTFEVPGAGRFGLSICYDQWFPEVARALAWKGADVILNPSMTGTIDREQELVLAQASAIMNQCYYVNVNSAGIGNGRSIIAGPEGDVLHQAGEVHEIMPLMLDLSRVRRTRTDGIKGLGQMLKSFRDTPMHFPCYNGAEEASPALRALGPLALPGRTR